MKNKTITLTMNLPQSNEVQTAAYQNSFTTPRKFIRSVALSAVISHESRKKKGIRKF